MGYSMDFLKIANQIEREMVKELHLDIFENRDDSPPRSARRHRPRHDHCAADERAAAQRLQEKKLQMEQAALERERELEELNQYIDKKLKAGHQAMNQGSYSVAIEQYQYVLNKDSTHFEAKDGVLKAYKKLGDQHYGRCEYLEAIRYYSKADDDSQAQEAFNTFIRELRIAERDTDHIPAGQPESTLQSYRAILSKITDIKEVIPSPVLFEFHKRLGEKISAEQKKVESMRAKAKIDSADKAFQTAFKPDIVQLSKKDATHLKAQLAEIREQYESAVRMDPNISMPPSYNMLQQFEEAVVQRIRDWTVFELGDSMVKQQNTLINYSLKRELNLESVIQCCKDWQKYYDPLLKTLSGHPPGAFPREAIDSIEKQAQDAHRRLQNYEGNLSVEIIEEILGEQGNFHPLSDGEYNSIRTELKNLIAEYPNLRDRLSSLTADGFRQFKEKLKAHFAPFVVQKSKLANCVVGFCGRPLTYKLIIHRPLPYSKVDNWLTELRFAITPDILEILNPQMLAPM